MSRQFKFSLHLTIMNNSCGLKINRQGQIDHIMQKGAQQRWNFFKHLTVSDFHHMNN